MLEASIKMSFFLQTHNLLKMWVIDMGIDSEESFKYCFNNIPEVWGKRCTKPLRENRFIIKLNFNPVHQIFDILWCWYLYGFLDLNTICPSIFVLWPCRHCWTIFWRAKLGKGAIKQIHLIEEVNRIDSQPLIEILPWGKSNCFPQISTTQCGINMFSKLCTLTSRRSTFLRAECPLIPAQAEEAHGAKGGRDDRVCNVNFSSRLPTQISLLFPFNCTKTDSSYSSCLPPILCHRIQCIFCLLIEISRIFFELGISRFFWNNSAPVRWISNQTLA